MEVDKKEKKEKLWFRAKTYGWGWYPSSKEGWHLLLAYFAIATGFIVWSEITENGGNKISTVISSIAVLVLTAALVYVCYKKCEKPEWRWETKKND